MAGHTNEPKSHLSGLYTIQQKAVGRLQPFQNAVNESQKEVINIPFASIQETGSCPGKSTASTRLLGSNTSTSSISGFRLPGMSLRGVKVDKTVGLANVSGSGIRHLNVEEGFSVSEPVVGELIREFQPGDVAASNEKGLETVPLQLVSPSQTSNQVPQSLQSSGTIKNLPIGGIMTVARSLSSGLQYPEQPQQPTLLQSQQQLEGSNQHIQAALSSYMTASSQEVYLDQINTNTLTIQSQGQGQGQQNANQQQQVTNNLLGNLVNQEIIQVSGLDVIPLSLDSNQVFWEQDEDGNYLLQDSSILGVNSSHLQAGSTFQVARMSTNQDQSSRALVNKNRSQQIQSIATGLQRRVPQRIARGRLKAEHNKPTGPGPYTCQTCAKKFTKSSLFKDHLKEHLNERQYSCEKCNKSFNKIINMQLHRMEHEVEVWCSLGSNRQADNNLDCPACSTDLKRLSRVAKIFLHLSNHKVADDLVCSRCEEEFVNQDMLDQHMEEKHNQIQTSFGFPTLQATENIPQSFDCNQCIATFSTRPELRAHEDDHRKKRSALRPLKKRGIKKPVSNMKLKFDCKFCSQKFTCFSKLDRHQRIHTGEKPFKCSICDKGFTQKTTLDTHELQHKGIKPHTCPLCKIGFTQRTHLRLHMKRVHDLSGKGFQCVLCSCSFDKVNYLHSHVTRFHPEEKKKVQDEYDALKKGEDKSRLISQNLNVEDKCISIMLPVVAHDTQIDHVQNIKFDVNKAAREKDILTRALESAVNSPLFSSQTLNTPESEPQKKFVVLEERTLDGRVSKHIVKRMLTGGVASYLCSWCPKSMKKPSDLIRHIRIHTKDKPYRCPLCSRTFRLKSILTTHFRLHQKPLLKCDICTKNFVFVADLKAHKIERHPLRDFNEGENYVPMVVTKDGIRPVPDSKRRLFNPSGEELRARNFECKLCHARFKRAGHLKTHMLHHSDVKRFTCVVCEKKCRTKSNLNEHMKIHSGEQHNECNICGKVYKWAQSLQYHIRTHRNRQNVSPFICPICKKSFKTKSSCKRHIDGHKLANLMDKHKNAIAQAKQLDNHGHLVGEDGNHDQHLIEGGCISVDDPIQEARNTDHVQPQLEIGSSLDIEPTNIRMNIKDLIQPISNVKPISTNIIDGSYPVPAPVIILQNTNSSEPSMHQQQIQLSGHENSQIIREGQLISGHQILVSQGVGQESGKLAETILEENTVEGSDDQVRNQILVDNEGTVLTTFDMVADSDGGLRLVESSQSHPMSSQFAEIRQLSSQFPASQELSSHFSRGHYLSSQISQSQQLSPPLGGQFVKNIETKPKENANIPVEIDSLPHGTSRAFNMTTTTMAPVMSNFLSNPSRNINAKYSITTLPSSASSISTQISSTLSTPVASTLSTQKSSFPLDMSTLQSSQIPSKLGSIASNQPNSILMQPDTINPGTDNLPDPGIPENHSLPGSPPPSNEDPIDYEVEMKTVKIPLNSSILSNVFRDTNEEGNTNNSNKQEIEKMIHSALRIDQPEANTKFRCGVCSFESGSIPLVLEHLKTHHEFEARTNKEEFILPIRFEEFPNTTIELVQDNEAQHITEKPREFSCDVCGDVFSNPTELMSHQKCHIVKYYSMHKCEVCKAEFRTKSGYLRHKNIHIKSNYHCGHIDCNMMFKNLSNLTKHNMKTHGGDPGEFIDVHTRRRLASQMKLSEDETRDLIGLPVKAGKTLSEQILIQTLTEKHNLSPTKSSSDKVVEQTGASKKIVHQCNICSKIFKKHNDLDRHSRVHTGEKPFQCKLCEKSFGFHSSLKNHLKTHTGGKSFSCHVCKSLFASKASLKIHMRIHTGSNPYKCQSCEEVFRTPAARKLHLARIHGYHKSDILPGAGSDLQNLDEDSLVPLVISAESLTQALQDIRDTNGQLESGLIGATLQLQLHGGEALVQLTVHHKILQQLQRKENINIVIKRKDLVQGKTIILEDCMVNPITHANHQPSNEIPGDLDQGVPLADSVHVDHTQQGSSSKDNQSFVVFQNNDLLSESSSGIFPVVNPPTLATKSITGLFPVVNAPVLESEKLQILQLPLINEIEQVKRKEEKSVDDRIETTSENQGLSGLEEVYKYICPWCAIVFSSEQDRISHLWSEHGVEVREDDIEVRENNIEVAEEERDNAEQHTLEKGDVVRDNAKQRRDVNTPEKKKSQQAAESADLEAPKHLCQICFKSFAKPSLLRRHGSVHSGEKPYSCDVCSKSFTQKTTLLVHQRIHEGSKPFTCEFCQQQFNQKSNLNNHIVRFHGHSNPGLSNAPP